jgi:hypothetical protein
LLTACDAWDPAFVLQDEEVALTAESNISELSSLSFTQGMRKAFGTTTVGLQALANR